MPFHSPVRYLSPCLEKLRAWHNEPVNCSRLGIRFPINMDVSPICALEVSLALPSPILVEDRFQIGA